MHIPGFREFRGWAQRLTGGHDRFAHDIADTFRQNRTRCLVDHGCGTMEVTRELATLLSGVRVVGCDINDHTDHARENPENLEFRLIEPFSLSRQDLHPDAVMLGGVIHHVPHADEEDFMTDVRDTLPQGGLLVVQEHRLSAHRVRQKIERTLLCAAESVVNRIPEDMVSHCNFFTAGRLHNLLVGSGFDIVSERSVGGQYVTIPMLNDNMVVLCRKR